VFQTRITELFGIQYPILAGAMQGLSRAGIVAAMANAGGLGFIASATFSTPEELEAEIRRARELTDRPIGVNINLFPGAHPRPVEEMVQVVVEQKVPVVETSGRSPERVLPVLRGGGAKVMHKCARLRDAETADRVGVDAVCVVGYECGGRPSMEEVATLVLVPAVVDAVNVPVVAGGGFADGRGLLAALALGADGVLMGTRFLLTTESIVHERVKQRYVQSRETDTVVVQKSMKAPSRVLRNETAERVLELESRGATAEEVMAAIGGGSTRQAMIAGDSEGGLMGCGQAVGLVHEIKSVQEVMRDIVRQAEQRARAIVR